MSGMALALVAVAATSGRAAETTPSSSGTERAWLGVYTQALTPELLEGMSYKGKGVLVNRVVPDSPADRAGVQKGDIITSFNSRTVDTPGALSDLVGQGKVGQSAPLRVVRDGKTQSLNARLAARSDDDGMGWMEGGPREIHIRELESGEPFDMDLGPGGMMRWMGRGRLGVRVEGLNSDLGGYFSVPGGKGVLVVEVMKDTPAEKAGLKAGDVITRVGDQAVADAEDLVQALGDDAGRVTLSIVRKGAKRTVEAELAKQERVIRIGRGEGPMGMGEGHDHVIRIRRGVGPGDDQSMSGGRASQRDVDDLRRQIEELRRRLDGLQHN
jgi:C-terminal processing protease CtpA/Prc